MLMRWLAVLTRRQQPLYSTRLRLVLAVTGLIMALFVLTSHVLIEAADRLLRAAPGSIPYGATVQGQLAADGTQDWQFVGNVGDVAAIHLVRTDGALVAGVTIQNAANQPLITVQAAQSGDLTLGDFPIPQPGVYTIHVFSVDHTAGSYSLMLNNTGTPAPSPTPNAQLVAGTLAYGQTVHGLLDVQSYTQTWTFTGAANDLVDLQMRILSGSGSDLSGFISVRGPHGDLIATSGGTRSASSALTGLLPTDAAIYGVKLPSDGTYTIQISRATTVGKPPFTAADYLLSLTLHSAAPPTGTGSGTVTGTPNAPTAIALNGTVSGQLTAALPVGTYQLPSGTLALRLTFSTPHRLAHIRVIDSTGAIVFDRSGLSPLAVSGMITGVDPLIAQIFAEGYDDQPTTDYGLSVYPASVTASTIRPAVPVHGLIANTVDTWFFIGEAGSLIDVALQTDSTNSAGLQAIVTAPNGSVLLQRRSGAPFDQPLLLPQTGAYQIAIQPSIGLSGAANGTSASTATSAGSATTTPLPPTIAYTLRLDSFGANGTAFSRFADGAASGMVTPAQPVNGTLGGANQIAGLPLVQRWMIDARAGQFFDLTAGTSRAVQPIGLLWIAPDGTILAGQAGTGTVLIERAAAPQDGRYTIAVFDPADFGTAAAAPTIPYALRLTEDSGGVLIAGQPTKSLLTAANALASWAIDVPSGSVIAAYLSAPGTNSPTNPAGSAPSFAPTLAVIDPGGQIVARVSTPDLLGYRASIGGQYHILVGGQFTGESASYILRADVQPIVADQPASTNQTDPASPSATAIPAVTSAPDQPITASPVNALITPPLPSQIGSTINSLPVLLFDQVLRGEIPAAGQQIWRVAAVAGTTLSVQAVPVSGGLAPTLALYDTDGHLLTESLASTSPALTASRVLQLQYASTTALQLYLVAAASPGARYTLYGETLALNKAPLAVTPGRPIRYGQPIYGELLTAGQVDQYLLYGSGSDLLTIAAQRVTDDLAPSITIQTLNGLAFATDKNTDALAVSTISGARLPESALYVITVRQAANAPKTSGRYWLEVERGGGTPDESLSGGILTLGTDPADSRSAVTGALIPSAVGSVWLLSGHAGEQISLTASNQSSPAPIAFQPFRIQLQDTAGTVFAAQDDPIGVNAIHLDHVTLPADGVYRVQVSGGSQAQGFYRLSGTIDPSAPANTGVIRYGQAVQGTFAPGHLANQWTFAGAAGDTIAVVLRSAYGQSFSPGFQIISASGVPFSTAADVNASGQARVDSLLLPFSGTYTIVAVNPDTNLASTEVYALNLSLLDTKAHSFGGVIQDGQSAVGELYPDDPVHTWLFTAHGGQSITAQATATDGFLHADLTVQTANGTVLGHAAASDQTASAALKRVPIPADGVYVLSVTGADHTTGSYKLDLALTTPPTPPTVLTPGTPQPGLIADDRLTSRFDFTGQIGERVHATVQRESTASLAVTLDLQDAAGHTLASVDADHGLNAVLDGYALPATGTYHLVVSRFNGALGLSTGRFTISLTLDPAVPAKSALSAGKVALGQLGDSQSADRWIFNGQAGQVISLGARVVGGDLDPVMNVYAPDGTPIAAVDDASKGMIGLNPVIDGVTLSVSGTYTVTVSRFGNRAQGSSGTYELRFNTLFANQAPPNAAIIADNQPIVAALDAVQASAIWSFAGTAGQVLQADLTYPIDDVPMTLTLQGADQTPVSLALADSTRRGTPNDGHSQITAYRLPVSGTYLLRVDRPVTTRAAYTPYTLSLNLSGGSAVVTASPVSPVIDAVPLTLDQPVNGQFSAAQPFIRYPLHVPAGKVVRAYLIAQSAGWQPVIGLFNHDGSLAASGGAGQTPFGVTTGFLLSAATADRDFSLIAQAIGDTPGAYRLSVQSSDPPFSVSSAANASGTAFAIAQQLSIGAPVRGTLIGGLPVAWRFAGAAKSIVSLALTFDSDLPQAVHGSLPGLSVLDAQGNILANAVLNGRELFIGQLPIPVNDQYVIVLTPSPGASTGLSFTLSSQIYSQYVPIDSPTPHAILPGVVQRGSLSAGKPSDAWTFDPSALNSATVTITRTGGNVRLAAAIYNPDGLIDAQTADSTQNILTFTLPTPILPGTHTLIVSRWQGAAGNTYGNYQIQIAPGTTAATATAAPSAATPSPALLAFLKQPALIPADDPRTAIGTLALNADTAATLTADQLVNRWQIASTYAGSIALTITGATIPLKAFIFDNQMHKLVVSSQTDSTGSLAMQGISQFAPYSVQIVPVMLGSVGSYHIRVAPALAPNGGGLLIQLPSELDPRPGFGSLNNDRLAQSWRLDLKDNQPIALTVQRKTGVLPLIGTLYDPAGQIIALTSAASGTQASAIVYSGMAAQAGRYTFVVAAPAGSASAGDTQYTIALSVS